MFFLICAQRRNEGVTIPRAPNHYGGAEKFNIVTSTFFNAVNLLPKDSGLNTGARNLFFAPGVI